MIESLVQIYGEAFVRYVLAIEDAPTLTDAILNNEQVAAAQVLQQFASAASSTMTDPHGVGRFSQLSQLGRWQEESGSSIANALRIHAGGELPAFVQPSDPLRNALLAVARDIWPSLLMTPPSSRPALFWTSVPIGLYTHPMTVDAAKAFLRDRNLKKLFPGAPTGRAINSLDLTGMSNVNASWTNSAGRGGTQQLSTLLGLIISSSHLRCLAEDGEVSWNSLMVAISTTIAVMRRLARGETVEIPRLIAFAGLKVPEGESVTMPHGKLRPTRRVDVDYLLHDSGSATCVFETTYPLRLRDISAWEIGESMPPHNWEQVRAEQRRAQRKIDLTRLAVLLSSPEDSFWALTEVGSLILDPTTAGGASQWSIQRPLASNGEVNSEGSERISSWFGIVEEKHPPELDIAMRRTLTAAGSRLDPIDGFVDAVVAWENCFGTSTETTFRVTAAMAAILETSDAAARLQKQKDLTKIYGKRSRVVHGAVDLSPQEAFTLRDSALRTAIECLRRLYSDRPDLLAMKSEQRSTQILLGS